METKDLIVSYIESLDKYRNSPDRTNRDCLHEAEYDLRKHLDYPVDKLEEIYKVR